MIRAEVQTVLYALDKWKPTTANHRDGAPRYMCTCPVHEDDEPSMVLDAKPDGRIFVHCYVGCDHADIEAAIRTRIGQH